MTMKKDFGTILRNFTPHGVTVITDGGERVFVSEGVARCATTTLAIGTLLGEIPLTMTEFGKVQDLPEPSPDTMYIVSRLVREALPDRNDLLIPNEIVRDEKGNIIGCKSFAIN